MKTWKKICKTGIFLGILLAILIELFNPDAQFLTLNIIAGIFGVIAFISLIALIIIKIRED